MVFICVRSIFISGTNLSSITGGLKNVTQRGAFSVQNQLTEFKLSDGFHLFRRADILNFAFYFAQPKVISSFLYQMRTWAGHLLDLYGNLKPPKQLPVDIQWLYPQQDAAVMKIFERFVLKYYNDNRSRRIFLGINPGRFGAGITGVNFTAPRQLKEHCGIDHEFKNQSELSAEFIYDMIAAYGGAEKFYSDFFIGSVCPLGFIKHGKNINYYDDKELLKTVEPFIIRSLQKLLDFTVDRNICFAIGGEKNLKYLSSLNDRFNWFAEIVPLPHPRFIMQYRRKQKQQFIQQYLQLIT